MRKTPFFALLLLATLLSGCAKKNWWEGTWKLDLPYTEKKLTEDPQIKPRVADTLKQMFSRAGEWQVTITPTEIIRGEGATASKLPYKVSGTPTATSVSLEGDGKTEAWTLEGEYLSTNLKAGMPVKLYFKRVK